MRKDRDHGLPVRPFGGGSLGAGALRSARTACQGAGGEIDHGGVLGDRRCPQKDLAADPKYAFATAGWFWDAENLNDQADESDIGAIGRSINGGTNGAAERREYYDRARKVLDAD
ncbi:hypothetical protein [Nocardia beijingensis]|uniref:hypothetical protein n=1 Tax=Nocardia beijingensis TaxID=95162 RepID=UPI0033CBA1C9